MWPITDYKMPQYTIEALQTTRKLTPYEPHPVNTDYDFIPQTARPSPVFVIMTALIASLNPTYCPEEAGWKVKEDWVKEELPKERIAGKTFQTMRALEWTKADWE